MLLAGDGKNFVIQMKTIRAIILLIGLALAFVFGLSLGVYTSHTNPDFYRQFTLFQNVISGQPLLIDDSIGDEADIPVLSDVPTPLAAELQQGDALAVLEEVSSTVPEDGRMVLTNLKGDTLDVTLLSLDGQSVTIRRERDGREFQLNMETLVESDRVVIEAWGRSQPADVSDADELDLDELFKMFDE